MNKDFINAMELLESEKKISKEVLLEAIENALVSAYKRNYGVQNVRVVIDSKTGDIKVYKIKTVVSEVENDLMEISIKDAKKIDKKYKKEDIIEEEVTPKDFGRIAAQTAKQVVVQRLREAERDMVYDEFSDKIGEIVNGIVQRAHNDTVFINIGSTEGILTFSEQVKNESYLPGTRLKVYVMDVKKTNNNKGTQVFLSRSHPNFVKKLFEFEITEISEGVVEIVNIAREAGSRTKMSVYALDENVDPVGACVGAKGMRVQSIVDELFGEKIDITSWCDDSADYIVGALNPAKVEEVIFNDENVKIATVIVPDYQLSLAIGKEGQNVRLAAKLTGWKIDIKSHSQYYPEYDEYEDDEYDDEYEEEENNENQETPNA